MKQPKLTFHEGTLILRNVECDSAPRFLRWDDRSRQWRAKASTYSALLRWLDGLDCQIDDAARRFRHLDLELRMAVKLRPYQEEALRAWLDQGGRGTVCLPTGSGKSWVGLMAIQKLSTNCLVVLPTLDLMNQWYGVISDAFGLEVGILGGGYHEIRDITVTTYDSAYRHIELYGNRFGLLIFDEVHHLPAATYSHIPEMSLAPNRLGLTATYKRADGLHGKLDCLVGPMVYEKTIKELEGDHLADYEVMRITVDLTRSERKAYDRSQEIYEGYIREKGIKFYGAEMQQFLQESASDQRARQAFLARLESRRIVIGAERKLEVLEALLKRHCGDQILVFTESNELVYQISTMFLVPALTHQTRTVERKQILDRFRSGVYSVLATSKVLNEGVDVPGASVAIILGGSASPVEHVQRLGRILRKSDNKQAVLYELVTRGTKESGVSYRRRQADAYK